MVILILHYVVNVQLMGTVLTKSNFNNSYGRVENCKPIISKHIWQRYRPAHIDIRILNPWNFHVTKNILFNKLPSCSAKTVEYGNIVQDTKVSK